MRTTKRVMGHTLKLKVSDTFLKTADCPRNLFKTYVDRSGKRIEHVAAARGSAAHDAIYDLTPWCVDNELQPCELSDDEVDRAVRYRTPPQIASEIPEILRWVDLWRDRFRFSDWRALDGFEQRIALNERFEEVPFTDASYRGIIDVLEIYGSHAVITDYKSQPNILGQTELAEHSQLTFYAWLVSKMYPHVDTITCRIWYLRYGFYHETTRHIADLETYERSLMIRIEKIADIDNWDPNPGKQCQYCDWIVDCPIAMDLGLAVPVIRTADEAHEAAQKLRVVSELQKRLNDGLREYVKKNDGVRLDDGYTYGYRASVTDSWDPGEVDDVLREHGKSLSDIATVDSRKMKQYIKAAARDDDDLAADLRNIKREKHSTRFSGYKTEERRDATPEHVHDEQGASPG